MAWHEQELRQLVGGQIRFAGLTQDGYPYLIVVKPQSHETIYVIAQSDVRGKEAWFLQLTQGCRETCP